MENNNMADNVYPILESLVIFTLGLGFWINGLNTTLHTSRIWLFISFNIIMLIWLAYIVYDKLK